MNLPKRARPCLDRAIHNVGGTRRTRLAALIDLKLSGNAQFRDRPRACKLIGTAASRGDQTMTRRLAECRAR
jgi:hypothetical protein